MYTHTYIFIYTHIYVHIYEIVKLWGMHICDLPDILQLLPETAAPNPHSSEVWVPTVSLPCQHM